MVEFCRSEKLKTTGSKIEINQRILNYLRTGEKQIPTPRTNSRTKAKFDWKNEKLALETEITDNYRNTENVRAFFEREIGSSFRFNIKFMDWMKASSGKTLKDAVEEWQRIKKANKNNAGPKEIAPQFEYNKYLRDFLADNPNSNRALGIKLWKIKKSMRGDNVYRKDDLELMKK